MAQIGVEGCLLVWASQCVAFIRYRQWSASPASLALPENSTPADNPKKVQSPSQRSHRRSHPLQPRRPHKRPVPVLLPPHPLPARRRLDRVHWLLIHRLRLQQRKHVEREGYD